VPAESISTRKSLPSVSSSRRKTPSAVGERQMLPMHTKRIAFPSISTRCDRGNSANEIPDSTLQQKLLLLNASKPRNGGQDLSMDETERKAEAYARRYYAELRKAGLASWTFDEFFEFCRPHAIKVVTSEARPVREPASV